MSSLLIKNAKYLVTMDGYDYHETGRELYGKSIFCVNGIIKGIYSNQKEISADKIIDASKNEKIEISKAENFLNQSKFGAVIYFVGTVRDLNENKTVTGITYDAKESMVIKSFEEIYKEADNKLNIKEKAVFIEHVKGYVGLKEKSIIIGVACKHRDQAFVLSRYIIEEIKKRSPIWKKEHYENEDSEWLKGVSLNN